MRRSAIAILLGALLTTNGAHAHSFLIDATPSAKDHVSGTPKTVKLRFGGGVEPSYSAVTVEGVDGKVIAQGPKGDRAKPRELTLDVATRLTSGWYVVRYRVLSTDGHIVEGNYEFFVDDK